MKLNHINPGFTDEEHLKIKTAKEYLNMTWHDFIIYLADTVKMDVDLK